MWRIRILASRFRSLFAGHDPDRELNREIEEHLRFLTERFVQQGMSPEDAEYAARRQFGGVTQLRECHRESRGIPSIENFLRDLFFSLRQLRKDPRFSLIAISVLALGLGANIAIFSLVNGTLLRPLPFAHPEKLAALFERDVVGNNDPYNAVAPANFLDWRREATTLEQIAGISYTRLNLSGGLESGAPERIDACACSANLFDTLGVVPALGRAFRPEEDRPGAPRTVVISYGLWKRRFNGSPGVLSSVIKLDSQSYSVVGVMPSDFSYPSRSIQAWIPLETYLPPVVLQAHDNHLLTVIGRIRTGVSVAQANAEIDAVVRRYKSQHPEEVMGKGGNVVSLAEFAVKDIRKLLLLLFGAVCCALLIACFNVTNLLLSRTVGRKREVAIRVALGASRGRIVSCSWKALSSPSLERWPGC